MNGITKKLVAEICRILLSAFLAAIGIEATGCIACGDGASASCVSSHVPHNK